MHREEDETEIDRDDHNHTQRNAGAGSRPVTRDIDAKPRVDFSVARSSLLREAQEPDCAVATQRRATSGYRRDALRSQKRGFKVVVLVVSLWAGVADARVVPMFSPPSEGY